MISATTTKQELRVKAVLDKSRYENGVTISQEQMKELNIKTTQAEPRVELLASPALQLSRPNSKCYFAASP